VIVADDRRVFNECRSAMASRSQFSAVCKDRESLGLLYLGREARPRGLQTSRMREYSRLHRVERECLRERSRGLAL
jgi:hypothetical protein